MIADLQDAGKASDEKQSFTKRRIILIIEDKSETSILLLEKDLTHKYGFNFLRENVSTGMVSTFLDIMKAQRWSQLS